MPIATTPRPLAQGKPPPMPGLIGVLTLVTFLIVVVALYSAQKILVPITLSILLSFVLAPLVQLLRRFYVPRVLSVLVAVIIGLGALGGLVGVIGVQVADLAVQAPQYAATLTSKLETLQGMTLGRLNELSNRLTRQTQHAPSRLPANTQTSESADAGAVPVVVRHPPSSSLATAQSILEPVLAPLESATIIFVVSVFILMQKEDLRDRLIWLIGSGDLHRTTTALDDAAYRLSRYFLSQLAINATFGVIIGIGLYLIGVPSPVLWGVLAAVLRFVPYVGPVIAAVLPAALAAAVSPHWAMALWTLGLFGVVESCTGQIIEPMIYGHSTGLSPIAVVIAAIFWAWLWGPIGLVLSTPLTLCVVVLGRHIDRLEFLDVLLGDRPPLSLVENFYRSMLADDPDEALQQAELLVKERSLTAYCDEVLLKGLQLAAADAQRGALSAEKMEGIKDSVRSVTVDLFSNDVRDAAAREKDQAQTAETKDEIDEAVAPHAPAGSSGGVASPPDWRTDSPILCLAGRGPYDDLASSVLVQLLGKHGLGARAVPYDAASREALADLDIRGASMVCISYLEISGSPAALHYLIRRLRQRMPSSPILVGLWPSEDMALKDERVRAVIGADFYTTSMREAIETCLGVVNQKPMTVERMAVQ